MIHNFEYMPSVKFKNQQVPDIWL